MINDCRGFTPGRSDGESSRRFSAVYKQSMERLEMSDILRSRILSTVPQLAAKKPMHQWVKAAGGVAACLIAIVAAGSLIPRVEQFQLSVQDNGAYETVSSTTAQTASPGALTQSDEDIPSLDGGSAGTNVSGSSAGDLDSKQATQENDAGSDAQDTGSGVIRSGGSGEEMASEAKKPAVANFSDETGKSVSPSANSVSPYGAMEENSSVPANDDLEEQGAVPEEAGESTEGSTSGGSTTASGVRLPNPLTEYATAEEAFEALGWEAPLPEGMTGSYTVIAGNLFQLDTAEGGCYRVGLSDSLGADVSGDYNPYAYDEQIETNGLSLRLRGEDAGEVTLVSWTANGFSISFSSPTAMTTEEAVNFAKAISG